MSSLKCWLQKIEKQDKISKEELNEIFNRLDGHDKAIRTDERTKVLDDFKKKIEFEEKWLFNCKVVNPNVTIALNTLKEYAEELKEGAE